MGEIRTYLLGVIAAALVCGIFTSLMGKKGGMGICVKLLASLLMILAVFSPWTNISFKGWFGWQEYLSMDGENAAAYGEEIAEDAYRAGIKQQIEAYILDEAKALDCDLSVEVTLTDEMLPLPKCVTLTGNISPYARQVIATKLTQQLGIAQEDQIWMG